MRSLQRTLRFYGIIKPIEAIILVLANGNLGRTFGKPQGFIGSISQFEAQLITILPNNNLGRICGRPQDLLGSYADENKSSAKQ